MTSGSSDGSATVLVARAVPSRGRARLHETNARHHVCYRQGAAQCERPECVDLRTIPEVHSVDGPEFMRRIGARRAASDTLFIVKACRKKRFRAAGRSVYLWLIEADARVIQR